MNIRFRVLDQENVTDDLVRDSAALHYSLLVRSPLSRLGPTFLREFYYRVLPQEGLMFAIVAYAGEVACGFIAATDSVRTMIVAAALRRPIRLAVTIAAALFRDPRRAGAIARIARIGRSKVADPNTGELLSLAVSERFLRERIDTASGRRISEELYERAMSRLSRREVTNVRAVVDTDNLAARLFYAGRGWISASHANERWPFPSIVLHHTGAISEEYQSCVE